MIKLLFKLGELKKETDIILINKDTVALVSYIKQQKLKETNIT